MSTVVLVILNILFPGVGSLIAGKIVQGICQLILWFFAAAFSFAVIGLVVGVPLYFIAVLWGIFTVVNATKTSAEVHGVRATAQPVKTFRDK